MAIDPREFNTRIAVFQCASDIPAPFQDQLVVKMTRESIANFVKRFHVDEGFFPGEGAFAEDIGADALAKRTADFYDDLSSAIPLGAREERYRWDFFTLELDREIVEDIKGRENESECTKLVESHCVLKQRPFGKALQHFGFDQFEANLKLVDLVTRWQDAARGEDVPQDWIEALCHDIHRAINNRPAEPRWAILKSALVENWWFYPILNHVRIMPDGRIEFDVYMYRSGEATAAVATGGPGRH